MKVLGILVLYISLSEGFSLWDESHARACPQLDPITELDISQLKGKWHASLTIVDTLLGGEDYEESDVCLTGELFMINTTSKSVKRDLGEPDDSLMNGTSLHQVWTLHSLHSHDPSAVIHVTSRLMRPGVLLLHTPLDGKVKATIYGYEKDKYMAVCGCGWRGGRLVHLWTAAISRDGTLTSLARQVVGRVLEQGEPQPPGVGTKIISWNTRCISNSS